MITLGIVALAALLLHSRDKNKAGMLVKLAFLLSLVVFVSMARTGYLGGLIRHTELLSSGTSTGIIEGAQQQEAGDDD